MGMKGCVLVCMSIYGPTAGSEEALSPLYEVREAIRNSSISKVLINTMLLEISLQVSTQPRIVCQYSAQGYAPNLAQYCMSATSTGLCVSN